MRPTGKMRKMSNDCIILDGVACGGCLSSHRLFCTRSIYSYWREVWLKRVDVTTATSSRPALREEAVER